MKEVKMSGEVTAEIIARYIHEGYKVKHILHGYEGYTNSWYGSSLILTDKKGNQMELYFPDDINLG